MRRQFCRAVISAASLALLVVATARAQEVPLPGQDNTAFGTTSAEFLLLGAGARGAALGGGFAAITTDVTAMYWNPGGLAQMERPGATFSYLDYVAGTSYSWGGIAFPFNAGQSAIGLQVGTFGFGDQPVYTLAAPEGDGTTYSVRETFIGGTFSQNFSDRFSAGVTLKYISDRLGQVDATAFAVDFGTSFHAMIGERPIRASFVVSNLGSSLRHSGAGLDVGVDRPAPPLQQEVPQDPQPARLDTKDFGLPVIFGVSIAYDFINNPASRFTLLSMFTQPNNTNPTAGGGLEWASHVGQSGFSVIARGSYTYQPDNDFNQANNPVSGFRTDLNGKEALDGLAVGGGLAYNRGTFTLGLDYGYRHLGILGGSNVVGATINW